MTAPAPPAAIGLMTRLLRACRAIWALYERQCESDERFRRLEERVWKLEQQ